MKEIEARILNVDPKDAKRRLERCGAEVRKAIHKQSRYVFDIDPSDDSRWIRVRTTDEGTTLAVKKVYHDDIDGTEEYEIAVGSEEDALAMLKIMGFTPKSYQENYRESYGIDDAQVTIDYWPRLKPYVEIEADTAAEVNQVARKLGYTHDQLSSTGNMKIYAAAGIDLNTIDRLVFDKGTEPQQVEVN